MNERRILCKFSPLFWQFLRKISLLLSTLTRVKLKGPRKILSPPVSFCLQKKTLRRQCLIFAANTTEKRLLTRDGYEHNFCQTSQEHSLSPTKRCHDGLRTISITSDFTLRSTHPVPVPCVHHLRPEDVPGLRALLRRGVELRARHGPRAADGGAQARPRHRQGRVHGALPRRGGLQVQVSLFGVPAGVQKFNYFRKL